MKHCYRKKKKMSDNIDNDYKYTVSNNTYLSEAEVWLRCFTSILTIPQNTIEWASKDADEALEEYKKRYGKDE